MNLVVQERSRAAFLLTDTATYDNSDGKVSGFYPKVIGFRAGKRFHGAIATSGRFLVSYLRPHLCDVRASTPAEFLAALPSVMRATERDLVRDRAQGSWAATVALFDRRSGRASGYGIANMPALFAPSCGPYSTHRISRYLTDAVEGFRVPDVCDPRRWDPKRDGEALIEAQRADLFRFGEVRCPAIGGQAILTRVDAGGVSHHVLKRWPDRVGEHIDLSSAPSLRWRDRLRGQLVLSRLRTRYALQLARSDGTLAA
jgi:hypothetical protein